MYESIIQSLIFPLLTAQLSPLPPTPPSEPYTNCGKNIDLSAFALEDINFARGSLSSPNFNVDYLQPEPVKYDIDEDITQYQYPNLADCLWTIKSPDNTLIKIQIHFIDVEGHTPECYFDQLQFFNNKLYDKEITEESDKIGGPYCGPSNSNFSSPFVYSDANFVQIKFNSDSNERGFGFYLKYSIIMRDLLYPDDQITSMNCTFDQGLETCPGWKVQLSRNDNRALQKFRFRPKHGKVLTQKIGPYQEHTNLPEKRGYYLHADASYPAVEGTSTTILSPVLKLKGKKNCLEFWLYLQNESIKDVNQMIKVKNQFDNTNYEEFITKSIQLDYPDKNWNGWKLVKINLNNENDLTNFQLNLTAIHIGKTNYDIGIDDIELYQGECKYFDYQCRPKYSAGQYIYKSVGKVTCDNEDNYRSVCEIQCKIGHHNFGSSPIVCERYGWSRPDNLKLIWPPPYCDYLECQKFDWDKKIFDVECSRDFNFRSECAFECKEDLKLVGQQLSTCHSNYSWGPDLPSCQSPNGDIEHKINFNNDTKTSTWFRNKDRQKARQKQLNLVMDPNFDPQAIAEAAKKTSASAGSAPIIKKPNPSSANKPVVTPLDTLAGGKSTDLPAKVDNKEVQVKIDKGITPTIPKTTETPIDFSDSDALANLFTKQTPVGPTAITTTTQLDIDGLVPLVQIDGRVLDSDTGSLPDDLTQIGFDGDDSNQSEEDIFAGMDEEDDDTEEVNYDDLQIFDENGVEEEYYDTEVDGNKNLEAGENGSLEGSEDHHKSSGNTTNTDGSSSSQLTFYYWIFLVSLILLL